MNQELNVQVLLERFERLHIQSDVLRTGARNFPFIKTGSTKRDTTSPSSRDPFRNNRIWTDSKPKGPEERRQSENQQLRLVNRKRKRTHQRKQNVHCKGSNGSKPGLK